MNTPAVSPPPTSSSTPPSPRRAPAPSAPASDRTPFLQGMLAGGLLMAIASGLMFFVLWRPQPAPMTIHAPPTPAPTVAATPAPLVVHLTGAVLQPGLYTLAAEARMVDAIDAAGGFAPDADAAQVNLALPLADGVQIAVPRLGEAAPASAPLVTLPVVQPQTRSSAITFGPINLNSATLEQLMELPGIGETKAQAIIAGRPYGSIDDLERVPGIGEKTIEELRPLVTTQ